jgi:MOSC domain-containing protein YiiM
MRLVAVSVGRPRMVERDGQKVLTSIFKEPVAGQRRVGRLNIEGDQQSDLSVHGGAAKAVYAYPSEHYPFWAASLELGSLPWASFGENLTTEGLSEAGVCIGDRYRIGTVELVVTQPRTPCFKLNVRVGRPDMTRRFLQSGRSGFYFSVVREGELEAGVPIERVSRDERGLSVLDVVRLISGELDDEGVMEKAIAHPGLTGGWREHFEGLRKDRKRAR